MAVWVTARQPEAQLSPLGAETPHSDLQSKSANSPTGFSLTWDQISAVARKPLLVDRHIPKPCRGLFEQVMTNCFEHAPALNDPMPGIGDLVFILPKLLLYRSSDKVMTYNQKVKFISRNCQTALRGDWVSLWQAAIDIPTPPFRRLGENDQVIGEGA